jgi:spectinomycin phosphotransferase
MREDRGLDAGTISTCLAAHYSLRVASITFLPIGNDFKAAVYRVVATNGAAYLLKIRFGPVYEPGLLVPRALCDLGIRNILAPLRTTASGLWCPFDGYEGAAAVLYPFLQGEIAKIAGLSEDQ